MVKNVTFNNEECEKATERFLKTDNSKELVSNTLIVYPNPTRGILNLDLKEKLDTDKKLYSYNVAGKQVGLYILSKGQTRFNFDISKLDGGIYFYECDINRGNTAKGKVILIE